MYIIELFNKLKKLRQPKEPEFEDYVEPVEEIEDALTCKHNFMPIDSTKKILACTKCGYVIKNEKMKFNSIDKNPFNLY